MHRKAVLFIAAVFALIACDSIGPSAAIEGQYVATVFEITPAGGETLDVLAAGGSLVINIESDLTTSGNLLVPAEVAGGADFTASMAGSATTQSSTVTFDQAADSFVRDLAWTFADGKLSALTQAAGSATFTIILTRQ